MNLKMFSQLSISECDSGKWWIIYWGKFVHGNFTQKKN